MITLLFNLLRGLVYQADFLIPRVLPIVLTAICKIAPNNITPKKTGTLGMKKIKEKIIPPKVKSIWSRGNQDFPEGIWALRLKKLLTKSPVIAPSPIKLPTQIGRIE